MNAKILSFVMIPVIAASLQVAKPDNASAEEPSEVHKLASIDTLCRRDIKIANGEIEKIMKDYSPAVQEMNRTYIVWRSSLKPEYDLEGYHRFNDAQVKVREYESALRNHFKIIGLCIEPSHER